MAFIAIVPILNVLQNFLDAKNQNSISIFHGFLMPETEFDQKYFHLFWILLIEYHIWIDDNFRALSFILAK